MSLGSVAFTTYEPGVNPRKLKAPFASVVAEALLPPVNEMVIPGIHGSEESFWSSSSRSNHTEPFTSPRPELLCTGAVVVGAAIVVDVVVVVAGVTNERIDPFTVPFVLEIVMRK